MKKNSLFYAFLFMMLFALTISACKKNSDDDGNTNPDDQGVDSTDAGKKTVYDLILEADTLEYISAAIEGGNLEAILDDESGNFTVFLPTDLAFEIFLDERGYGSLDEITPDTLTMILMNHVIEGKVISSGAFTTGYEKTTAMCGNYNLSLYVNTIGELMLNGETAIIDPDHEAENGIVHVVDRVIDLPTIGVFLESDPELSLYYEGLVFMEEQQQSDMLFLLYGYQEAPFTVFAPQDSGVVNFFENKDLQTNTWQAYANTQGSFYVITNHIADTLIVSSQIEAETELYTRTPRYYLIFDVTTTPITVDGIAPPYYHTEAGLVQADIIACNGILHKLNEVIYEDYDYSQTSKTR